MATHVMQIELSAGIHDVYGLNRYEEAFIVVRWHGRPLGAIRMKVGADHSIAATDLCRAIADRFGPDLTQQSLLEWMLGTEDERMSGLQSPLTASVIICTRDRVEDLRRCLDSLMRLRTRNVEVVVVDNAPPNDETAQLVAEYAVRYVREDRKGLNWARARGARAATGDIVIFTDDDVVVDASWVDAMLEPFGNPRVAAVTGLIMPVELETEAQHMFERYGSFSRGFRRIVFDYSTIVPAAAGRVGAGASMAFRRTIVNRMALFDAELDCGTVTLTGGDAYAFYRLLAEGYQVVYTPDALAWHRHRRSRDALRNTLYGYSLGGFAFLTRCLLQHGDLQAIRVGWEWLRWHHLRQIKRWILRRPTAQPIDVTLAEIWGCLSGPRAYFASRAYERAAIVKTPAAGVAATGDQL